MLTRKLALVALCTSLAAPAFAGELPAFLKDKKYATDAIACSADHGENEVGALAIDKAGIFGYEFGCTFLEFWHHSDAEGALLDVTALVSCGDDSGITRPDMITIIKDSDETLRVQSQNEFVQGELAAMSAPTPAEGEEDSDEPINFDFVSATYTLCK